MIRAQFLASAEIPVASAAGQDACLHAVMVLFSRVVCWICYKVWLRVGLQFMCVWVCGQPTASPTTDFRLRQKLPSMLTRMASGTFCSPMADSKALK